MKALVLLVAVAGMCLTLGCASSSFSHYQLRIYRARAGYVAYVETRIDIESPSHSPNWLTERKSACDSAKNATQRWLANHGYDVAECAVVGYPSEVNQGGIMTIELVAGDVDFVRQSMAFPRKLNSQSSSLVRLGTTEGSFAEGK
jgi:hypothetical protein